MTTDPHVGLLRRYVLGNATEDESAAVEDAYFHDPDLLLYVRAAETDLIDDYVADQLAALERERFERHYLRSPDHRRRVELARLIARAASAASGEPRGRTLRVAAWAAGLAAALAIGAGIGVWIRSHAVEPDPLAVRPPRVTAAPPPAAAPQRAQPPAPAPHPASPVVVALSVSPILVRGGEQDGSLTIGDAEVVRLHLQGDPNDRSADNGRVVLRTVTGTEIWRGRATPAVASTPPHALARIDIPAALLRPDDYIVALFGTDAGGRDVERYRYYFRVRAP